MQSITNATGYEWSFKEIADVCGVSTQAITWTFRKARRRLWRMLDNDPELRAQLHEPGALARSHRLFLR